VAVACFYQIFFLQEHFHAILKSKNLARLCTLPESTNFHHFRSKESAQIEVCLWKNGGLKFQEKTQQEIVFLLAIFCSMK
jgi:hypothetical protein